MSHFKAKMHHKFDSRHPSICLYVRYMWSLTQNAPSLPIVARAHFWEPELQKVAKMALSPNVATQLSG